MAADQTPAVRVWPDPDCCGTCAAIAASKRAASGDTATTQPRPLGHVDIPAWFRAAADAVEALDWAGTAYQLRDIASQLTPGDPASDEGAREAEAAMWRAFVSNVTPAEAVPAARPGGPATASAWPSPDDIEYDGPDHPLEDYRTWRRYVAVPVADDDAVEVVGVVPPHDFEPIARANPHPGDVDPHDEAVFALCNIVHEQITAAGIHCPDTGAAVLCWDLAARLVGAGVTLLRDDDRPAVVEVAVETLEASHRRLLHAQGLIGTEIGRVSLVLRRAAGAVVPDPDPTATED